MRATSKLAMLTVDKNTANLTHLQVILNLTEKQAKRGKGPNGNSAQTSKGILDSYPTATRYLLFKTIYS